MKLRRLILLTAALQIMFFSWANAQIFKPIDPNKKTDVGDKSVNFGDAQLQTVTQPTRDLPNASLSKGNLKQQGFETQQVDFQTLVKPTIDRPVLPQANFTAKRIAVKVNKDTDKNLPHVKEKAPVTNRQIRPFTPGGEQELKKQLNEPH